jgi:hypothetical protein
MSQQSPQPAWQEWQNQANTEEATAERRERRKNASLRQATRDELVWYTPLSRKVGASWELVPSKELEEWRMERERTTRATPIAQFRPDPLAGFPALRFFLPDDCKNYRSRRWPSNFGHAVKIDKSHDGLAKKEKRVLMPFDHYDSEGVSRRSAEFEEYDNWTKERAALAVATFDPLQLSAPPLSHETSERIRIATKNATKYLWDENRRILESSPPEKVGMPAYLALIAAAADSYAATLAQCWTREALAELGSLAPWLDWIAKTVVSHFSAPYRVWHPATGTPEGMADLEAIIYGVIRREIEFPAGELPPKWDNWTREQRLGFCLQTVKIRKADFLKPNPKITRPQLDQWLTNSMPESSIACKRIESRMREYLCGQAETNRAA